jgi:replicative DNA helicase
MVESEQAVLRSLLTDWAVSRALCEEAGIKADYFKEYDWAYDELFKMAKSIEVPDYLGFVGWLKKQNYDACYIERLKDIGKAKVKNLEQHLKILQDEHLGDEALLAMVDYRDAIEKAEGGTVRKVIEKMLQKMMELSKPVHKVRTFKETIRDVVDSWKNAKKGVNIFIPTRFKELNDATGGWPVGVVTLLTARDGVGKSFLVGNEVLDKGSKNIPTDYYPFEDGEDKATGRMVCHYLQAEPLQFLTGSTKEKALEDAGKAEDALGDYPIRIIGRHMNMTELCSSIVRGVLQNGTRIVFIDGWKDIEEEHYEWNELREEKWQFNKLTAVAERYNIAIVVVMHLTKIQRNITITEDMIRGNGLIGCGARMKLVLQDVLPKEEGFKPHYPNSMRLDAVKVTNGRNVQVEVVPDFATATMRLADEETSGDTMEMGEELF